MAEEPSAVDVAGPPAAEPETCRLPEATGPGAQATDARVPELEDLTLLSQSKLTMSAALAEAEERYGAAIEAKYELDDSGALSLSLYPLGADAGLDAERNVFQELAADPTIAPLAGEVSAFADEAHVTRAARELTLVQLSGRSLREAVADAEHEGIVFWAVPTIRAGKPGDGIYAKKPGCVVSYRFADGLTSGLRQLTDHGASPGDGATDARVPELGRDPSVVRAGRVSIARGIAFVTPDIGAPIEAKLELDDAGKPSLSVYWAGRGAGVDAERNTFGELAGDATIAPWAPTLSRFAMPERGHLARSARDLTIVQTASLELGEAVAQVEAANAGGIVFWAVPTIRLQRAGYGVYVDAADGTVHYFFVS